MKQEQNDFDKLSALNSDRRELISIYDLLAPLWQARWSIAVITVLVMTCIVSWSILNATYRSQGFFQFGGSIPQVEMHRQEGRERISDKELGKEKQKETVKEDPDPGISLSDFKRFAASYETVERFNDYIQEKKLESMPGVAEGRQIFSRSEISKSIEPIYPFTKLDVKELVDQPKGNSNNVIGLRISYESKSPQVAKEMVGLLGRYTIDSIVYLIYSDLLRSKSNEIRIKMTELDNAVIKENIRLEEYRRKAADLKQIIKSNPGASVDLRGQVVTITDDTARYLPPARLLTTTEFRISEANEAIRKAKRERLQNQLFLEYYDRVKLVLDNTKSGEMVLGSLEVVKESIFKDKNLKDDVVMEAYNMITVNNQLALNLYLNKSRFIAGPTLPDHSTVRLSGLLAISLVIGLLISILFVYGRKSWRNNNQALFSRQH